MKHYYQKHLGEVRLFELHFHMVGHHQTESGQEPGQELKQRPWEGGATYRLAALGLFSLFSYTTQGYLPRMIAPTAGRALAQHSLTKIMPDKPAYKPI